MRVLIDTNVLISAALNTSGVPYLAYAKASIPPYSPMICEQNADEMIRVFHKKFPRRMSSLIQFLTGALVALEFVPVPSEETPLEELLRDTDDRLILRAAISRRADIILTGDKDFLESGIRHPMMMTPSQFLMY